MNHIRKNSGVGQYQASEPERARDALFYTDSGCSRDEWTRICMAAKSAGISFDDFHEWSKAGNNYKDRQDCVSVWNSFKESGGVTSATLFSTAIKQGWEDPNKAYKKNANYSQRDPVKEPNKKNPALKTWAICTPAPPDHPYIARKLGHTDGLRVYPDNAPPLVIKNQSVAGWLVTPAWGDGQIQTLQFIPPHGGEKLNLPGASFNDGYFTVGDMPDNTAYSGEMHVMEGIGQAWAANQVKVSPAVVCFGAGRMPRIAMLLRATYPAATLVIVPDRGKEADAAKIAAAVSGCYLEMPSDKPPNYDINDYLLEYGKDSLAALLRKTREPPSQVYQEPEIDYSTMPDYGGHPQTEPAPFQLVQIKSLIDNPIPIRWTIKGFLEKGGMNLISGPYGSGKSFVAFDMGFCVAAGINWIGNKVIQSPVIILAGEGHSGIADRFAALEIKYGISCPECLYVSQIPAQLTDGVNARWVSEAVNQICPDAGLIIVDTLNRNFGGLDENSTKDMTLFTNNMDNIFRITNKTSMIVHHTGHAETNRARGNSSLPGACEGEFIIKGQDGGLILICEKQKNAAKAAPLQFRYKRIEIPGRTDDEGEPVASLVLEWDGEATVDKKRIKLSGRDDLILTSLREAITERGIEPVSEIKEKFGGFDSLEGKCKKVVHIDYWRARAYPVIDAESANGKIKAFKRTRDKLVDVGKVRCWDDYWWYL